MLGLGQKVASNKIKIVATLESTLFQRVANVEPASILGAYHLTSNSGNFGLKSNGKVIFRKFRSEL